MIELFRPARKTGMLSAGLLMAGVTIAQDSDIPAYDLGEITITGFGAHVAEQVTSTSVITAEDIRRSGARTLDEAMMLLPGLNLRLGAQGTTLLDVRGLRTRNVLLLLDGVPLNSTFDGLFDPATLSTAGIARITFQRGPGSVLYGPGGNGGVINVVTRGAGATKDAAALLESSDAEATTLNVRGALPVGDVRVVAAATLLDRDGFDLADDFVPTSLEDGGERLGSDRDDRSVFASATYNGEDNSLLGISINYRDGDRGTPPITEDARQNDFAPGARFERVDYEAFSLQASGQRQTENSSWHPVLFYNRSDELTNAFDDGTYSTQDAAGAFREDSSADTLGARLQVAYRPADHWVTSLALGIREDQWQASGFELARMGGPGGGNQPPVLRGIAENHDARVAQAGVEAEWSSSGPFAAVFGASYARQERDDSSEDADGVELFVGASYQAGETRIRGSAGRRIRFPTLGDLYARGRGNPELDVERTVEYEIAIERGFNRDATQLSVALFRSDADDFIQGIPGGVLGNIAEARREGIEMLIDHAFDKRWQFSSSFTYLDAVDRSGETEQTLQNQPRYRITTALDYSPNSQWNLRAQGVHVRDQIALSRRGPTRELDLGDYTTIDLIGSRSFSSGRYRVIARVTNAFDENYVTSIGFPAPGRIAFLGVEVSL